MFSITKINAKNIQLTGNSFHIRRISKWDKLRLKVSKRYARLGIHYVLISKNARNTKMDSFKELISNRAHEQKLESLIYNKKRNSLH